MSCRSGCVMTSAKVPCNPPMCQDFRWVWLMITDQGTLWSDTHSRQYLHETLAVPTGSKRQCWGSSSGGDTPPLLNPPSTKAIPTRMPKLEMYWVWKFPHQIPSLRVNTIIKGLAPWPNHTSWAMNRFGHYPLFCMRSSSAACKKVRQGNFPPPEERR